jgi:hypothetical protein
MSIMYMYILYLLQKHVNIFIYGIFREHIAMEGEEKLCS